MAITKIGTPELFDFSATNTALQLPTGDTASRPSAPSAGQWRFNTTEKYVEYWDGGSPGAWRQIDTESSAPPPVANENFNTNTYLGSGATHTIDAKFNEAATFNGSSSYIQLPNDSFTYTTMTFSAWVNPAEDDLYNYIFQNGMYDNRISGSIGWYVRREQGGALLARGFSSNSLSAAEFDVTSASGIIPLNTWTNVVFVLTPTSFNIYVNGNSSAVATASFSNPITYSSSQPAAVHIGVSYYYFNADVYESWWGGAIDQARIYSDALTTSEIYHVYNNETTTTAAQLNPSGFPTNCVAAYQLDGNANDISTNYNGTTNVVGYSGLKFKPDLVWVKLRSSSSSSSPHALFDSIRGVNEILQTNDAAQEANLGSYGVSSFDSNGFTVNDVTGGNNAVNGAPGGTFSGAANYVAWCFKAAASNATNGQGSEQSTIRANQAAGFSIVKSTTTGSNYTVGHGLGVRPKLVINKNLNEGTYPYGPWWVWIEGVTGTDGDYARFNSQNGKFAWSDTFTTATTIKYNTDFQGATSGQGIISYAFADIAGYQSIGSYTWTGSSYTAGTMVTGLGFTPRFVMIKGTDVISNWMLYDNLRVSGTQSFRLAANIPDAEDTSGYQGIILDSDGFSAGTGADGNVTGSDGLNQNGKTYIYLAIA